MKNLLIILLLGSGVWISSAQTNDMTNAIAGVTNVTADIVTNITTNAVAQMPAIAPTNSTAVMVETNHPAASRPPRVKMTIHSEGPYQMDLNDRWITYQDHVQVTEGQMTMKCEWLMANLPLGTEHITNIVAQTNVVGDFIDNKNRKWHATGDKGVYTYHVQDGVTNETVTLTGNPPEIQEGEETNTMTGDAIIYDLVTKKVTIPNPTSTFWHDTNSPAGTNSFAPKI
jgi:lipopolysaccharide transport protein LptA